MRSISDQELFWKGSFGDEYTARNAGASNHVSANIAMFAKVLKNAVQNLAAGSIIEFGSNVGLNLIALKALLPYAELTGVEINEKAFNELKKIEYIKTHNASIYDFPLERAWDLAFTKGVLIHQLPELLPKAYEILYKASQKYILIAEYYNPSPVEINYRGYSSVLFKRDFAGEMMERYPDLVLNDYGFVYHKDYLFPQDDLTWFLLEKK